MTSPGADEITSFRDARPAVAGYPATARDQARARLLNAAEAEASAVAGRHTRRHRRTMALTAAVAGGALAAAAGVGLTIVPRHGHGQSTPAALAAWTVVRAPDGSVRVTLRELRDAAGLQRELRADGIPASVAFGGTPGRSSCRGAGGKFDHEFYKVFPRAPKLVEIRPNGSRVVVRPTLRQPRVAPQLDPVMLMGISLPQRRAVIVIRPAAIPRDTGIGIRVLAMGALAGSHRPSPPPKIVRVGHGRPVVPVPGRSATPQATATVAYGLVQASPGCTGS
jgi:hypothetical protein